MSGQAAFDKPVRPAALHRKEAAEETELNGVEEEHDKMSDEEEGETEDEGELAAPDWKVRAGPRSKPTQREREEHEATHVPFRDWCAYCMMGRVVPIITLQNRRVKISQEDLSSHWITFS